MRRIDLSHVIEDGMVTYPGLPPVSINDFLSRNDSEAHYDEGTRFQIGRIGMVVNTGTYIDAPFHRYEAGTDIAGLDLDRLSGLPGRLFHAPSGERAIDASLFADEDLTGCAVLVHTGWDRHWGSPDYFRGYPYLTRDAAEHLRDSGAALVGIDSLNIDDTTGGTRPVHSMLLAAGIPIVEHLCRLDLLADLRFSFHAVPAPVRGVGSFPVRAFADVEP